MVILEMQYDELSENYSLQDFNQLAQKLPENLGSSNFNVPSNLKHEINEDKIKEETIDCDVTDVSNQF